jgi:hypothetical protein
MNMRFVVDFIDAAQKVQVRCAYHKAPKYGRADAAA